MKLKSLAVAAMLLPLPAFSDSLMVLDAWVPTAPPTTMTHAAYVTLHNHGTSARVLTNVAADGYGMSHLHQSGETDGVATMTMLHQIEIPAGGMLSMKPGGLHVMLMHPKSPIADGSSVPLVLTFANGETLTVDAIVKPIDAES